MYNKCFHCGCDTFIAEIDNNTSAVVKEERFDYVDTNNEINGVCYNCSTPQKLYINKLEILFYSKTIEQYLKEI